MDSDLLGRVPSCKQGSEAPMFRGEGDNQFICHCGQVMIDGYHPRQYAGIGLECFSCNAFHLSESWPAGEPLPYNMVTLGSAGCFLLGSTVDVTGKAGLTCDQEIARVGQETGAKPRSGEPLYLTLEAFDALENKLNSLSDGEFSRAIRSVTRAGARGNSNFFNSLSAWALCKLRSSLKSNLINIGDEQTKAALCFLHTLVHLIDRWEHHPLFSSMSKGLVLEYPHAITQLIAAAYLSEHGNPIGFNDHNKFSGRSPDLFINANFLETISLEVKAPSELQWPNQCPSLNRMETLLEKHLRNAKQQIKGELGGIVVIGTSWASRDGEQIFNEAIKNLDTRNKISSRIAGVVGVCLDVSSEYSFAPGGQLNSETSASVSVHLNSKFRGDQFIKS